MSELLLGLDIGGTKIGVCVGTRDGSVLANEQLKVDHALAPEQMLAACKERLEALVTRVGGGMGRGAGKRVAGLGCACPGPIDYANGKFLNPPNNPGWHGFELRAWLRGNFEVPSVIMNDANVAALSESLWGAAKGTRTSVFLTMSTGLGAGLVIDGRLFEGPLGLAGEIGQIRLTRGDDGPVGFGKRGSVEGYLSGPGMVQMAMSEALICTQRQTPSVLRDVMKARGTITTEELCKAAQAGDAAAVRVTDRVALELGRLCSILTDILNPEVIVLGTIGAAYPELFIQGAMKEVQRESIPESAKLVRIVGSGFAPNERGDKQALAAAMIGSSGGTGVPPV